MQLFVTPETIGKKIKKMKDNKSYGVDVIITKLVSSKNIEQNWCYGKIIEQISAPLAKVFN